MEITQSRLAKLIEHQEYLANMYNYTREMHIIRLGKAGLGANLAEVATDEADQDFEVAGLNSIVLRNRIEIQYLQCELS